MVCLKEARVTITTIAILMVAGVFVLIGGLLLGRSARRPCPNPECGHWNSAYARFCGRCGRSLTP